jgi:hypothetical protein
VNAMPTVGRPASVIIAVPSFTRRTPAPHEPPLSATLPTA